MLSCFESASQICSSLTVPCSIRTRPSRCPDVFCTPSAATSCSCVISFCAISVSPRRIFSGRPIVSPFGASCVRLGGLCAARQKKQGQPLSGLPLAQFEAERGGGGSALAQSLGLRYCDAANIGLCASG